MNLKQKTLLLGTAFTLCVICAFVCNLPLSGLFVLAAIGLIVAWVSALLNALGV